MTSSHKCVDINNNDENNKKKSFHRRRWWCQHPPSTSRIEMNENTNDDYHDYCYRLDLLVLDADIVCEKVIKTASAIIQFDVSRVYLYLNR